MGRCGHKETGSNDFGGRYLMYLVMYLAIDPQDPNRLYAMAQGGELLASSDGGRRWQPFMAR